MVGEGRAKTSKSWHANRVPKRPARGIATDELFNGLNSNGEIAVGLCVEGPVLLNIWEFPHRSRQSSYHTQFILTSIY
jgi:hypothetical protein